jgi:hypothetical protein
VRKVAVLLRLGDGAEDGGEQIGVVGRDAAGEGAQRLQPVRAQQLLGVSDISRGSRKTMMAPAIRPWVSQVWCALQTTGSGSLRSGSGARA